LLEYDDGSLQPRLSLFHGFRQYENLHMLFWIAKDLSWNTLNLPFWVLSMGLTVLLALDFICITVAAITQHDALTEVSSYPDWLLSVVISLNKTNKPFGVSAWHR
jgi:hypothetical protein